MTNAWRTQLSSFALVVSALLLQQPAQAFDSRVEQRLSLTNAMRAAVDGRHISVEMADVVLPQFVDGSGWQTTVVLTNLDSTARHYAMYLVSDRGDLMSVSMAGQPASPRWIGQLQPNQTVILESSGTSTFLTQGYALIFTLDRTADDSNSQALPAKIAGFGIFRQRAGGRPDFEAVVPLVSLLTERATIPFDNRSGFATGIALANSDLSESSTVTVTARDLTGNVLRTETITLNPGTKIAFSVPARYPELAGRAGILQFRTNQAMSVLGLRFNPSGPFTSIHPLTLAE